MSNVNIILEYLNTHNNSICDDCISSRCSIVPRQTVNQICNKLFKQEVIKRDKNLCSFCNSVKITNIINEKIDISNLTNHSLEDSKSIVKKSKISEDKKDFNIEKNKYSDTEFLETTLLFQEKNIVDVFKNYNSSTLRETMEKDRYIKLKEQVNKNYKECLDYPLGEFLYSLKTGNSDFYKLFLNPYGDSQYCIFSFINREFYERKGIYVYKLNNKIVYIGRVKGINTFNTRINQGYANISPKNCYIDGQSTNCRVNSLINSHAKSIKLFILPLDNDKEIIKLEKILIDLLKPEWNIQLR